MLLSNNWNIPVLTLNPKYSTILVTRKKIDSIQAKNKTLLLLIYDRLKVVYLFF